MNTKIVRRILPAIFALLLSAPLSAQWTIPVATSPANSAVDLGNGCFQMTSNLTSQRGVVWNNTQLNLNNPFDITLTVTMTGNQFGADGLAFILQNSGLATFGPGARSLGYLTDGMLTGISPSIGVEMDLRPNGGFGNDNVIPQDHVALHENGNPTAISGPVQALLNGGDISTGVCHELRILWTPPTTMTVQVDGNTLFTRTNNLVTNIFGGNPNVFWGFAGSTGGSVTNMVICANAAADFADAGPDTTICLGSTLQLQASGGLDYAWTDPLTLLSANNIADPTFTPAIPGIFPFPLTVTNNACSDTNIVLVTVTPPPTAAISTSTGDTLLCTGDTLLLTASGGGDYAWSTPASTATISVTNPGTYTVTVTDNSTPAACADTTAVTILGVTPPVADAGANDTICVGDTITVGGVSSTGPNIVYTWTPTAGLSNPSIAQPQAFPTATTTYTLTVDSAGVCSATDDITITVQDTPLVSVTPVPDSICAGQSAVLTSSVSGGAGGYLYAWSSGGTGSNEPVSPLTTTSYALTVTDANGCAGEAFATVIVSAQDSIDITVPDTFTCNGGSIDITNTFDTGGIDTWQWSPTTGVSNPSDPNSTITPPTSTTYFLSGLNSQTGCGYTDSIQIDAFDLVVNYWTDSTVCLGDTIEFDIQPSGGSGNYSYLWLSTTSDTVVNDTAGTTLVGPTVDGMFTVLVTDNVSGCNTQFSINLEVTQLDVMAFPQSELINPGQRVELLATGAITYVCSPDTLIDCSTCPDPVVKPNESTNYTVVGTDTNGCRGTATVVISVDSFLVPNVFTPNNDGINDVLLLNYYGEGDYEIAVFDRWGKQIYSTTDTDGAWNGRNNNGEEVPEGVYYLVVRVVGDFAIPDKDKQRVFNVTLMR
ncbi:MAG: gliding motility-associated C-terminal domain-containing protein [Bacteroidota bacterium]